MDENPTLSAAAKVADQERRKKAAKNIAQIKHKFVLQLGQAGRTHQEILGIIGLIDWKQETEWMVEELFLKEGNTPSPVPGASRVEIPKDSKPTVDEKEKELAMDPTPSEIPSERQSQPAE
jgi:hypothetical protein